jgi:hypothetical protein
MNSDLSDIATALTGSLPRDGQAGMTGPLKVADGSTIQPAWCFTNELNTGFSRPDTGNIGVIVQGVQVGTFDSNGWDGPTTTGIPIGGLLDYSGSVVDVPPLWILCFGQAVSRTTYAKLFAAVSTTYGSGDGATTFNVPDCRGRVRGGLDDMGGSAAGRLTTSFFTSPTTLGGTGGGQSNNLGTANAPSYTPSGGVGINDSGHLHSYDPFRGGEELTNGIFPGGASGGNQNTTINTTGVSAFFSGNNNGGSSSAFRTIQPTILFKTIIFAGA